jgi:hypothetical protein
MFRNLHISISCPPQIKFKYQCRTILGQSPFILRKYMTLHTIAAHQEQLRFVAATFSLVIFNRKVIW